MAQPSARPLLRSLLLCLIAPAIAAAQPLPPPTLGERIETIVTARPFDRAVWGIAVEDDGGALDYRRSAGTLMIPASNRKLLTAATAASCLGVDRQLSTELWLDGSDVIIRGGGDPSLGGRWSFDRAAVFAPFIDALRVRGVREVEGDVVADASLFDRVTRPFSWEWSDLDAYYGAPVDALAYNENVAGVVVDDCAKPRVSIDPPFVPAIVNVICAPAGEPIVRADAANTLHVTGEMAAHFETLAAIADPALYAGQAFRDALARAGITVRGTVRVNVAPRAWRERVAVIESPAVALLISVALQPSQNLYAEMLYKLASAGVAPASYQASAAAERMFLTTEAGVDNSEFKFADGSGLSAQNLVTPNALVKVLRWMDQPSRRGVWWQLLAAPGEEGTLRRRLLPLAARLRGKTGSISGVNSLSGIVRGMGGGTRYFSIVLNHHTAGSAEALRAIDAIANAIADF